MRCEVSLPLPERANIRHQRDGSPNEQLEASNAITLPKWWEERSSCKSDADDSPFVSDTHALINNDGFTERTVSISYPHPLTNLTHQQQPQPQPTRPPSQALRSVSQTTIVSNKNISVAKTTCQGFTKERRPTYLYTRAHRIWWPDPLRPNRIYFAELLDVDDVNPPAHDLVEAGVGGFEAVLDVANCLMLDGC
jgi:hypothetical protein